MFSIKQNDDYPNFTKQIEPSKSMSGIASVDFHMETLDSGTVVVSNSGIVESESDKKLSYKWPNSGTQSPGHYYGEFEVTYSDSGIESFPKFEDRKGYDIEILEEID
jgi:hypothetical protein